MFKGHYDGENPISFFQGLYFFSTRERVTGNKRYYDLGDDVYFFNSIEEAKDESRALYTLYNSAIIEFSINSSNTITSLNKLYEFKDYDSSQEEVRFVKKVDEQDDSKYYVEKEVPRAEIWTELNLTPSYFSKNAVEVLNNKYLISGIVAETRERENLSRKHNI